jgi:hypothetical protein
VRIAIVAAIAVLAGSGAVDQTKFRYERAVGTFGKDPVAVEPDGLLLSHTKPGLADLRVLDAEGEQVPWRPWPQVEEAVQSAVILNSGTRGGRAVALLDLGPKRRTYDRIELQIPTTNFVGRVTVFGSDSRNGRFTRLSSTGIYDIAGAESARSTTAVVPPSDFRYLSLRATGAKRINGATVSGAGDRQRLVRRDHIVISGPGPSQGESVFVLDFGVPDVPVTELAFFLVGRAAARAYERPIRIEGSNDGEDYELLTRARVFRFPGSRSAPVSFRSRFRYLRVTIENGDDRPLRGVRLDTFAPSQAILLEPGHERPFRLLYGGPEVQAPNYEFARIPAPEPGTFVAPDQLGVERLNRAFEPPPDTRSFAERNPKVLQGALALAAVALCVGGFLALRRRT